MDKNKLKEFTFQCKATEIAIGIVYAKSREEAIELIKNGNYDDIIETCDFELDTDTTEIIDVNENVNVYTIKESNEVKVVTEKDIKM